VFHDSTIAKHNYVAVLGLAEHFKTVLDSSIRGQYSVSQYSVSFDESLNKKDQSKQMEKAFYLKETNVQFTDLKMNIWSWKVLEKCLNLGLRFLFEP
jgi:hypothetical protein